MIVKNIKPVRQQQNYCEAITVWGATWEKNCIMIAFKTRSNENRKKEKWWGCGFKGLIHINIVNGIFNFRHASTWINDSSFKKVVN